ncbi:tRNA(m5U54)methyltransferase [Diatrype stigma]|uniref:tRNA(M5U54)methyltransferase n=1 Tax=Diatrype stigma TaxID=117547 RepID=A0AAN9UXZ9_9PEZI
MRSKKAQAQARALTIPVPHQASSGRRERLALSLNTLDALGARRQLHTEPVKDTQRFWGMMADQLPKTHNGKRSFQQHRGSRFTNKRAQKKARKRERDMKNGSAEEVLKFDVQELYDSLNEPNDAAVPNGDEATLAEAAAEESLPEQGSEIEVEVAELSSTGDGLALQKGSKRIYVVPFTVPGDVVKVKVYRHLEEEGYTVADFLSVVKPSPARDDSRIGCKYFATCSGCQFQMLDYAEQLRLKKRVVEKAFRNFSQLPPELIPAIQDTIGSPLQYNYRTKLTPHFDGPSGWKRNKTPFSKRPEIGFMPKGKRTTLDIEDCPIGTDVVRLGMKLERERMEVEYNKYTRGATILLRESTKRIPKDTPAPAEVEELDPASTVKVETDKHIDLKTCITDNKATSTEYIGDFVFHNPAGSFFQNNNSILPVFTNYIRDHVLLPPNSPAGSSPSAETATHTHTHTHTDTSTPIITPNLSTPIKYLIDAYSGSGLFTITLSSLFESSTGIDIAEGSIAFARRNATDNGLPPSQANFIAADARELFKSIQYDPDRTVVILDPPRKGCDADFLGQLLRFGPRRVVYVSCNVHTQARDVGMLVRGDASEDVGEEEKKFNGDGQGKQGQEKGENGDIQGSRYEIESLRGFDFFPQTSHVEGVAVLNRVEAIAT